MVLYVAIFPFVACLTLICSKIFRSFTSSSPQHQHQSSPASNPAPSSPLGAEHRFARTARVFSARTTHTRLFPAKHSFSYSYLVVGIPIAPCKNKNPPEPPDTTSLLLGVTSTDPPSSWLPLRPLLNYLLSFAVLPPDHLQRGGHYPTGLHGKLRAFLLERDPSLLDTDAYLITAPRFLGYVFNPVSFWYLYRGEELVAMILEVNNTFDERHCYIIHADRINLKDEELMQGEQPPRRFRGSHAKQFHVSPFNSRLGRYTLSATPIFSFPNPITSDKSSAVLVNTPDNLLTLLSSQSHSKLTARLYGSSPPLDLHTATTAQTLNLLLLYGWVGFATYPRILWEAAKLFLVRKLKVFYRPEPLPGGVGRKEKESEKKVEERFREYLKWLTERGGTSVERVRYRCDALREPVDDVFTRGTSQEARARSGDEDEAGSEGQDSDTDSERTVVVDYPSSEGSAISDKQTSPTSNSPTASQETERHQLTLTILTPQFYANLPPYPSFSSALLSEMYPAHPHQRTVSISLTPVLPSPEMSAERWTRDADNNVPEPREWLEEKRELRDRLKEAFEYESDGTMAVQERWKDLLGVCDASTGGRRSWGAARAWGRICRQIADRFLEGVAGC